MPTTPQNPTPNEHDPGTPTPEDPRQNEPIHDPPVDPEQDPKGSVVFDENGKPG